MELLTLCNDIKKNITSAIMSEYKGMLVVRPIAAPLLFTGKQKKREREKEKPWAWPKLGQNGLGRGALCDLSLA